jgi:hypothetical protein
VEGFLSTGVKINEACSLACVEKRVFYRWKKTLGVLKNCADNTTVGVVADMPVEDEATLENAVVPPFVVPPAVVPMTVVKLNTGHARSLNTGRVSFLAPKKMQLLRWIFEQREQGLQVTTRLVRKVAEKLLPELCEKNIRSRDQIVRRFLFSAGLVHRVSTHVAQRDPKEMEGTAQEFMSLMRHKVGNMNPDHVLNMDQTPIPFSYHSKRTWEEKGVKTVNSRASTCDTKRATLAATVTMSGEVLLPLLIFKGAKNGRIEKYELPTLPPVCLYAVQKKAWMDESMMAVWIEQVLSPWKDTLPPNAVPLLILDSFRVHMMGRIVTKIQSLGIEVQHIPGGCTYLCQPIDVGVNKPIKNKVAEQWEDWVDMEGVQQGKEMKTPSREVIANWVGEAYWTLNEETCKNAWKKKGYEWKI